MVSHWLRIHDILRKDLPHLQSAVLFQYELMMRVNPSEFVSNVLGQIDISPGMQIETLNYVAALVKAEKTHTPDFGRSRSRAIVQQGSEYDWVAAYERHLSKPRHACSVMLKMYESRVNEYGYSLHHPRSLKEPAPFARWYAKGYGGQLTG